MEAERHEHESVVTSRVPLEKVSTTSSNDSTSVSSTGLQADQQLQSRSNRAKGRLINLPVKPLTSYSAELVPIYGDSPWQHYRQYLSLDLGGSVAVVYKIPATKELYALRKLSEPNMEEKLYILRQLRHENLLLSHEIFSSKDGNFVVSELAAASLDEFTVVCLDETQLAAIIYQILSGIAFLASRNLTHGAINCSSILLSSSGIVKIANPEICRQRSPKNIFEDTQALGTVMEQLMRKGAEEEVFDLEISDQWSAEAIEFSVMARTASALELREHPFLKHPPQTNELVRLVFFTQLSAYRFYEIVP